MRGLDIRFFAVALACGLLAPGAALAEDAASAAAATSSSSGAGLALSPGANGPNPDAGLALASFMLYPSSFAGLVFNDNLYSTASNRVAGLGVRLRPSFEARLDDGLHQTSVYFTTDLQIYPGQGDAYVFTPQPTVYAPPTNATGRAGFSHQWLPTADLSIQAVADYARQNGLFGASPATANFTPFTLPSASTVSAAPQYSNQYSAFVSIEKKFEEQWFLTAKTGAQYVAYDSRPSVAPVASLATGLAPITASQDGLIYMASLRGGYYVTPQLYAFVEPQADLRFYRNSWSDTNGYRLISGVGSDLISLFKGEVYGGYQSQASAHGYFAPSSSPAFGVRLYYYPTHYLTLTTSLDQTLTAAAPQPTGLLLGVPVFALEAGQSSKTLQARVEADYAMAEYWSAFLRGGYGETSYANGRGPQTIWTGGAGLNYNFWPNLGVTFEYQYTRSFAAPSAQAVALVSPIAAPAPAASALGFAQNLLTMGLTYRY